MRKRKLSKSRTQQYSHIEGKPNKSKRTATFIVGGIVLLMVFSSVALSFFYSFDRGEVDSNSEDNVIEYNGIKFEVQGNNLVANINGIGFNFEYSPGSLIDIETISLSNQDFSQKTYILFDPSEFSSNSLELLKIKQFLNSLGAVASFACIKEENCGDLPIKSCDSEAGLVYLKTGDNTKIYKQDNCVVLEAKSGDELRAINRYEYAILGV